ncbi:RagB/SusD family nutrient uptake outer membrane protein [Halalkalibaculum sp. DA3122]|uniref:RagB/SusD family nutrient uptake outer membrane protein n=1 Tax=Halalkalibaculum sp. DA3122 TaxID=3373607 RepID=UPI0037545C76
MNTQKITLLGLVILMMATNCDSLEYRPDDQLTADVVKESPQLLKDITDGNYSTLRTRNYIRNRHFTQEMTSDDVLLVKSTGDNLMLTYAFEHNVNHDRARQLWQTTYRGLYPVNQVIESISDDASEDRLQLKGENLFIRALMHFDLVRIFGRPYSQNPEENLGVMIRDNTDTKALPPRSTVEETYQFIVNDLLKAAELMSEEKSSIYASKEVAFALLARMYLYMGQYENAIEYADKVINSGRYELLPTEQFGDYFTILPENNSETIFAIKLMESENMEKGSIGSMYHGLDGGWGEIYASASYRELIYQHENDERINFIDPHYIYDENGNRIPDSSEDSGYQVEKRNGYSKYYINKYTGEGGVPLLSSPIVLRLAEMYLIKAEAYAKTNREDEAIDMVNMIRERAGLSGNQLYSINDLKGYDTVLDVVLVEKRLELAWEGHRSYDMFNNNRPIDRSYVNPTGWSGPSGEVSPTCDCIPHLIPEEEIILNSNLEQNPIHPGF